MDKSAAGSRIWREKWENRAAGRCAQTVWKISRIPTAPLSERRGSFLFGCSVNAQRIRFIITAADLQPLRRSRTVRRRFHVCRPSVFGLPIITYAAESESVVRRSRTDSSELRKTGYGTETPSPFYLCADRRSARRSDACLRLF